MSLIRRRRFPKSGLLVLGAITVLGLAGACDETALIGLEGSGGSNSGTGGAGSGGGSGQGSGGNAGETGGDSGSGGAGPKCGARDVTGRAARSAAGRLAGGRYVGSGNHVNYRQSGIA